jgi:hypothetical protein
MGVNVKRSNEKAIKIDSLYFILCDIGFSAVNVIKSEYPRHMALLCLVKEQVNYFDFDECKEWL